MKNARTAWLAIAPLVIFSLLAGGCGKASEKTAGSDKVSEQTKSTNEEELFQLGLAYQSYSNIYNKAPVSADDFLKMQQDADEQGKKMVQQAVQAAKSGKYIIFWGVTAFEMAKAAGVSNTILAYEKDVPKSGGLVLIGDGSVKKMTSAEFQSAPKAKGK